MGVGEKRVTLGRKASKGGHTWTLLQRRLGKYVVYSEGLGKMEKNEGLKSLILL